jgi:hypothetical protein
MLDIGKRSHPRQDEKAFSLGTRKGRSKEESAPKKG